MSNLTDWLNWVTTQDVAGTLPPISSAPAPVTPVAATHDAPDSLGLINIPELGEGRWAVAEMENVVKDNQQAYWTLVENIQNALFSEARGWAPYGYVLPAVQNSLTGGWQLAPYEQKVPNARTSVKATVAETIAYYGAK